jgi:pyridoxal phosphate enzyme (YggS family)
MNNPVAPISARLTQVRQQIASCAYSCDRSPEDITLIAVSKTKPVTDIIAAYDAGQRTFGVNYLQEAEAKITMLADYDIEWHFIGRIQSNKTASISRYFDWVHTVGSLKHAHRLNEQRPQALPPLNICIQLNLSGESSKSGISADELAALAVQIHELPRLNLRGLMTMPPAASTEQEQRELFSRLRLLRTNLQQQGLPLDTLSMGMSNDMQAAICEGATMVRIGTAIFGARS